MLWLMSSSRTTSECAPGSPTIALRLAIAAELGWQARCLDPETGWLWQLERGERRYVLHGSHAAINDHAASALALDKAYTAMALRELGLRVPESARCLGPGQVLDALGRDPFPRLRGLAPALALAERVGYPLVVKPNRGSRGRAVKLVRDQAELEAAAETAWAVDRIALVQVPVPGFDLRVDVLDGELLLAYVRRPLVLVGDGSSTLLELHRQADARVLDETFAAKIRATPAWHDNLAAHQLEPESVLPAGERLEFRTTIYNLHMCCVGSLVPSLPPQWVELCAKIGAFMGLRHLGVDLRLPLPEGVALDDEAALLDQPVEAATVLEVNASPAVGQIAKLGGRAEAEAAERRIVETMFAVRAALPSASSD